MATLADIRDMEQAIDDLTRRYTKRGDKKLLGEIDRLHDKIDAAEAAIAAEKAAEQKTAAAGRMFTPPVEPTNSEETKRRVLEEIEELAEDPELDDQPRTRRQLRSLKQEVLANAITPEHGAMEPPLRLFPTRNGYQLVLAVAAIDSSPSRRASVRRARSGCRGC